MENLSIGLMTCTGIRCHASRTTLTSWRELSILLNRSLSEKTSSCLRDCKLAQPLFALVSKYTTIHVLMSSAQLYTQQFMWMVIH